VGDWVDTGLGTLKGSTIGAVVGTVGALALAYFIKNPVLIETLSVGALSGMSIGAVAGGINGAMTPSEPSVTDGQQKAEIGTPAHEQVKSITRQHNTKVEALLDKALGVENQLPLTPSERAKFVRVSENVIHDNSNLVKLGNEKQLATAITNKLMETPETRAILNKEGEKSFLWEMATPEQRENGIRDKLEPAITKMLANNKSELQAAMSLATNQRGYAAIDQSTVVAAKRVGAGARETGVQLAGAEATHAIPQLNGERSIA